VIEPLRVTTTTPQLTAFIPIRIPREEIRKVMGPGLAELKAAVAAQNVAVVGPWFTHHVRNPGEVFDFEICLPVAALVAPANRVQPGEWPAMKIAQTTYHGGYEGLGTAWGELMTWIEAEGHVAASSLWEVYLEETPCRTELTRPLVKS